MPIYEYKCPQCNNVFEEWTTSYAETAPCPNCNEVAIQIISNTSFVLKGGGWYVTEYGNKKNVNEETGASSSSSNAEQKTEKNEPANKNSTEQSSTSESKASEKTETKPAKTSTSSSETSNTTPV